MEFHEVIIGWGYYSGIRAKSYHPEGLTITCSLLGLALTNLILAAELCLIGNKIFIGS